MIAYLRGKLLLWREDYLILDVNGVGYRVFTPSSVFGKLPPKGEEVSVYIYTSVREDAIILYGFLTEGELELFKHLISVNGIGPKVALGILSTLSVSAFKKAVAYEDIKTLKKIPGIGEKTAKRLILELKNKLQTQILKVEEEKVIEPGSIPMVEEAVDALMVLGYSRTEAFGAVEQVKDKNSVEGLIRQALKILGQGRS
ncbi:Holliday junction DNA helicase RuvA [Anoxybacter fermentans]|uniref:Holliday junction branch migration complex subunit RuvA n=1 Tax=Anoxybacter fermentans TaxID=1323375 RepID=A0A3Q9HQ06_9FIRM|nr:Holliday junction branch migration protein RuvA [Anoxybacter fermentans]AZR73111.1 Holliday junction DNA helicase RuvA [Anoxybacter fermentans]